TVEMESMQDSLGNLTNAAVNVSGVVFPGTKICIGDSSMVVQGQMQYCKFIRTGGEVKMTAL
ncbi:MAG: FapA family protein, partial [Lachnospiraceae bacterium]|nr:FapA family protein [Lachnospiraceae bacterium]